MDTLLSQGRCFSVHALSLTDLGARPMTVKEPPSGPRGCLQIIPGLAPQENLLELDSSQAPPLSAHPTRRRPSTGPAPPRSLLSAFRHAPIWPRGFWEMWANSHQVHALTLSTHYNSRRAPHAAGTNLPRPPPRHAQRGPQYVGEGNPDVQRPGACRAPPSTASRAEGLSSKPGTPLPHSRLGL